MSSRRASGRLSEADADALLSGLSAGENGDLQELVRLMSAVANAPAPAPTAALAAVLHGGFDAPAVPEKTAPARRWTVRIAVVTATAMTAVLGAASANALPASVQTAVANVVGAVSPLELPRPQAPARTGSDDEDGASDEPATAPPTAPDPGDATATTRVPGRATPSPLAPAVVTPARPLGPSVPSPGEPDEDEVDEPETGETAVDEPGTGEAGETGETGSDEPEQPEAESSAAEQDAPDDQEPLDALETEVDADQESDVDEVQPDA